MRLGLPIAAAAALGLAVAMIFSRPVQATESATFDGAALRERGWLVRIVGYSPSSGHAEPSWAVEMPIREAREVGSRFKQDAIFAVRGDRLRVIRCGASCLSAVVGSFLERLDGDTKNHGCHRTT